MEGVILFIPFLYFVFLLWGIWTWYSYPLLSNVAHFPVVSILIAARNEEENLPVLFRSLEKLQYPLEHLELIFVDDFSEDGTFEMIKRYKEESRFVIQLLPNEKPSSTPKKDALQLAIHHAKGELFLFTDADCEVPENWVLHMVSPFQDSKIGLVFGPIRYLEGHFIEKMLSQEQAALMGSALASLSWHIPSMCNGANMAIRRRTFEMVNGFATQSRSASGDDELLLHKVFAQDSKAIRFVKSQEAIVTTEAVSTWKSLFAQRTRWAGKWEKYLFWRTKAFAFFIFLFHVSWLTLPFWAFQHLLSWHYCVLLWMLKMVLEGVFIGFIMKFLGKKINLWVFLALQVLYSPYVVFFALISRKQSFAWKGRILK